MMPGVTAVRALLIDDDARLSELLRDYLGPHGIVVAHAPDGEKGLLALAGGGFDVVLLDLMMPGIDGLETCRRIRQKSAIPVLMLTAKGDETDRVVGLELGADDYLPKPFSPRELLARIRAVLRRAMPRGVDEELVVGDLEIRVGAREVTCGGRGVALTGIEFDLLLALARRAGRVVPRDMLLDLAGRSDTTVGERTVDVHVSHLRQKLGVERNRIRTVRGVGYLLAKGTE
jgi:DNA-binding response OmpR family regulator